MENCTFCFSLLLIRPSPFGSRVAKPRKSPLKAKTRRNTAPAAAAAAGQSREHLSSRGRRRRTARQIIGRTWPHCSSYGPSQQGRLVLPLLCRSRRPQIPPLFPALPFGPMATSIPQPSTLAFRVRPPSQLPHPVERLRRRAVRQCPRPPDPLGHLLPPSTPTPTDHSALGRSFAVLRGPSALNSVRPFPPSHTN